MAPLIGPVSEPESTVNVLLTGMKQKSNALLLPTYVSSIPVYDILSLVYVQQVSQSDA